MDITEPSLTVLSKFWLNSGDIFREAAASPLQSSSAAAADALQVVSFLSPASVASGKLLASYDAARAVSLLWQRQESHLVADYALLRAVLECAALAWWVIVPTDSEERVRRAARVIRDDLGQALIREKSAVKDAIDHKMVRETRAAIIPRIEERLDRVTASLSAAGIQLKEADAKKTRLDLHAILHEAENCIEGVRPLDFTLSWAILSSLSHGSLEAMMQSADVEVDTTGVRFIAADPEQVAAYALGITPLLHAGHDRWNEYCAPLVPKDSAAENANRSG
ncbi:hypothetical protein [Rathayibacter festucae]|uniref:hypothetical protein n=1 Tax=Rathayibacter festucae TaxID=110937 RepID=UPI000FDCDA67|nr:hypothetical protein [Rathayibacter festucae]